MNSDIAIKVENLGKCYQIYDNSLDRLKQLFSRRNKKYYREFWALQDVSFEVKKGEAFGIIGKNGAGKSTLLQLICKTLNPTKGSIETKGKIAALLELGSGFNPEFTGRENIYINGAILGFSHQEIDDRFEEIIAFADIGDFIDQPVKNYSSGMYVRLAFAVQVCVEPDILIIDEALSVGDIFFQQKCFARLRKLQSQGITVIFVSHDMSIIRDLCARVLYLRNGKINFIGEALKAINKYFNEGNTNKTSPPPETIQNNIKNPVETNSSISTNNTINELKENACWEYEQGSSQEDGNPQKAKILAVAVVDLNNNPTNSFTMGEDCRIKVLYQTLIEKPIHVNITFKNRYNQIVSICNSYISETPLLNLNKGDLAMFEMQTKLLLESGLYNFSVGLGDVNLVNKGTVLANTPWLGPLTISWDFEQKKAPFLGMFGLPFSTKFISVIPTD